MHNNFIILTASLLGMVCLHVVSITNLTSRSNLIAKDMKSYRFNSRPITNILDETKTTGHSMYSIYMHNFNRNIYMYIYMYTHIYIFIYIYICIYNLYIHIYTCEIVNYGIKYNLYKPRKIKKKNYCNI